MRIVAVYSNDASEDLAKDILESVFFDADRVLLFGALAKSVSLCVRQKKAAHDERFLDDAADYVLSGRKEKSPKRQSIDDKYNKLVCVSKYEAHEFAPLKHVERAVEMSGVAVCMGLPKRALKDEDLENADVWIIGHRDDGLLGESANIFAPGDFAKTGCALQVRFNQKAARVCFISKSGIQSEGLRLSFVERTSMKVV